MVTYVSFGPRDFGDHPHRPTTRGHWEFYAVLRGRLAPFGPALPPPQPVASTLWLLPPESLHGWVGEPGRRTSVAVFHFATIPDSVAHAVNPPAHATSTPLSASAAARLGRLARDLQTLCWNQDPLLEFHSGRALMELALQLFAQPAAPHAPHLPPRSAETRIHAAAHWLRTHLHESPGVTDLARFVGVAPSHLRRLFLTRLGCSPKDWMLRTQLEIAAENLLADDTKLSAVAASSGFKSCSTLCHAFRVATGLTPSEWRDTFGENRSSPLFTRAQGHPRPCPAAHA